MIKALILAAGYATRLYPLTKEYPKPLLKVKKKPIIDYIIDKIKPVKEIGEIIVITNSKFFPHFLKWQKGSKIDRPLSIVDDLTKDNAGRLGAVGDIDFAIENKKIKEDLLVIGGDNIFDGDLKKMISFAGENKNSPLIGAYDIKERQKAKKYGVIKLDQKNKIVDFQEKPADPQSSIVAMCLYYLPRAIHALIKEYTGNKSMISDTTGAYIDWLRRKVPVYAFVFGGHWYDIGDHKFYNEAKQDFPHIKGGR